MFLNCLCVIVISLGVIVFVWLLVCLLVWFLVI